jgi:hypothetical protein
MCMEIWMGKLLFMHNSYGTDSCALEHSLVPEPSAYMRGFMIRNVWSNAHRILKYQKNLMLSKADSNKLVYCKVFLVDINKPVQSVKFQNSVITFHWVLVSDWCSEHKCHIYGSDITWQCTYNQIIFMKMCTALKTRIDATC